MIKDIIFDWDGTLVNTLPFLKETFDQTFKHLNQTPLSYDKIRQIIHENPEKDMFSCVFGMDNAYQAKRFFHTYTLHHHIAKLQEIVGAKQVLDFCQLHNIRCHIFSNKKNSVLKQEVQHLSWLKYFTTIIGAGDLTKDKPTICACEEFCALTDINSSNTLVVGDGPADSVSARFWHCPVAIITTQEKYIGPKPDYTLQNIQEILPLLQTMLY